MTEVELTKRLTPTWPQLKVVETGLVNEELSIHKKVRTAITLVRLKNETEYKLIQVRYDQELPEENAELSWIEGMLSFLGNVQLQIKYWDGKSGITDNNQND